MNKKTHNMFSPILVALQEIYDAQDNTVKAWTDDIRIVERTDSEFGVIWFVREDQLESVLHEDDLELLKENDLLHLEGGAQRVTRGGVAQKAIGVLFDALKKKSRSAESEASQVLVLSRKTVELEKQLRVARETGATDAAFADLIYQIANHFADGKYQPKPPELAKRAKTPKDKELGGVPTLFLSDWHWGEVVDPHQVEFFNEYDLKIAASRADRVFRETLQQLTVRQSGMHFPSITCALGGDMFSGNIHEELRITNDATILECVMSLAEKLQGGLVQLSEAFNEVYVPCVVGNHGRMDKKPSAKNKVKDNYDWLLYKMLEMAVMTANRGRNNIRFDISEAADLRFDHYDTRFLLTHGDQFKSAGGVGGIFPGLMKTDYRKRKRSMQAGRGGYDYLMMGHWHQYGTLEGIIVNGSLKGVDEYSYNGNFGMEPPQQALWVTHPTAGITMHMPIRGEAPAPESDVVKSIPPITSLSNINREQAIATGLVASNRRVRAR